MTFRAIQIFGTLVLLLSVIGVAPGCDESGGGRASDVPVTAEEMEVAVRNALDTPDTLDRTARLSDLMQGLDARTLVGAQRAFEERMRAVESQDAALFANAAARIDPLAAIEYFRTWDRGGLRRAALSEAVFYWTRHGGASEARKLAASEAEGIDGPRRRNVVINATAKGLAVTGAYDELNALLADYPDEAARDALVFAVLRELYRRDWEAPRAWYDSISWSEEDLALKRAMTRIFMSLQTRADGRIGAALYEEHESNDPEGAPVLLESVARVWAEQEPAASIGWVLERPEGSERIAALRSVAYEWLEREPEAAAPWITDHLEDPVIEDAMLFPLTQWMMTSDLQRALELAEGLDRPNQRSRALKQILVLWGREDYEAADRYMTEVGVPEDVERAVRGVLRIRRRQSEAAGSGEPE